MFDDFFEVLDFGGEAADVASPGDIGEGYFDLVDSGEVGADIASDAGSASEFSANLSEGTAMGDYDGFGFGDDSIPGQSDPYYLDSGGPMDTGEYQVPNYDYGMDYTQSGSTQYQTAIGPGLNGTPMAPIGGSDANSSWFGGVTSTIAKAFSGLSLPSSQPRVGSTSTVYARGYPASGGSSYSNPNLLQQLFGAKPQAYGRAPQQQSFLSKLFGGSSQQGSGDMTTVMMLGGLALVGVAMFARR